MNYNKIINVIERSGGSLYPSTVNVFIFHTLSNTGRLFSDKLEKAFSCHNLKETSASICNMGGSSSINAIYQCKGPVWVRPSIPQVQKACVYAPTRDAALQGQLRVTWEELWGKLTQTACISLQYLLHSGTCTGRGVPDTQSS